MKKKYNKVNNYLNFTNPITSKVIDNTSNSKEKNINLQNYNNYNPNYSNNKQEIYQRLSNNLNNK